METTDTETVLNAAEGLLNSMDGGDDGLLDGNEQKIGASIAMSLLVIARELKRMNDTIDLDR